MTRRRSSHWRRVKRDMQPNRVTARFISGGRHQTWTAILTSPFKEHTVHTPKSGRRAYQQRMAKERKARQTAAVKQRVKQPRAKKTAAPRPGKIVIATDPRTGKPITWAQAQKAVRDASARAERLAAGLPGDAPERTPRTPAAKKAAAPRKNASRKKAADPPAPLAPVSAPGKNLTGLYLAATCPCQGTGRIYTMREGRITGSVSCPRHGRTARGGRRVTSRRAMTNSGLPGVAGWLAERYRRPRGNMDRKQQRAVKQARRGRYAGPTVVCEACDSGTVNRKLTDRLREHYIAELIKMLEGEGKRVPSKRSLAAAASRAYPYDRCSVCKGIGSVPDEHAGPWFGRTKLPEKHTPTPREIATGKRRK